jgi:hypothetical protein
MEKELKNGYNSISENYGFYLDKVPQNILGNLKMEIDKIQNNFNSGVKINNKLAGEIQHEYVLPMEDSSMSESFNNFIKNVADKFGKECDFYRYKEVPLLLDNNLWVNFQKKHEYNPIHTHYGVFSFVIWYQVPYYFEDEQKYCYKDKYSPHGDFAFQHVKNGYGDKIEIKSSNLSVDKNMEGYMVLFPSNLYHCVYPFYSSDEYRISVAGNILSSIQHLNYKPD